VKPHTLLSNKNQNTYPNRTCCVWWREGQSLPHCSRHYIYTERKQIINPLKPNDPYRGRTAPLTPKRCILYVYSTNISTEYFKHGIYYPFFFLQNAVCSIILTYLVPVLFTFYIQVCKNLKNNAGAERLMP